MQVVAHFKARVWQPLGLVASFRYSERNLSRMVVGSRQGNAIVAGHEEVGTSPI